MCTWTCRPSAAASRRRRASSGMNRTIASSTSRSTPLGRIRCANGATWSSTNPAAAGPRARSSGGRSAGPATPAGHRTGPGPRSAGAGAAARGPHRGRPCRSRWAARPRPRTRPHRTPRPAAHPGRRPGPGCRRTGPRRRSTPPGAGPPTRRRRGAGRPRRRPRRHGGPGRTRAPRQRCQLRCRGWWWLPGHGPILVEQVFESRVESVEIRLGNLGDPKVGRGRCGGGFETVAAQPPQPPRPCHPEGDPKPRGLRPSLRFSTHGPHPRPRGWSPTELDHRERPPGRRPEPPRPPSRLCAFPNHGPHPRPRGVVNGARPPRPPGRRPEAPRPPRRCASTHDIPQP